jgi:hypothetical protein
MPAVFFHLQLTLNGERNQELAAAAVAKFGTKIRIGHLDYRNAGHTILSDLLIDSLDSPAKNPLALPASPQEASCFAFLRERWQWTFAPARESVFQRIPCGTES